MLIIGHAVVRDMLAGRELALIDQVREAYRAHHDGDAAVPKSSFLRFPGNARDRIIALPAYLGGGQPAAGIKWISSFPENIHSGMARASGAIILNSLRTGRPTVLVEGSLISMKRTAASAALAAGLLVPDPAPAGVVLIGCGVINLEVLRFLAASFPDLGEVALYDIDPVRVGAFAERCRRAIPGAKVYAAGEPAEALARHRLISIATTASTPHLDLRTCPPATVVLHLSLRDIEPATIIGHRNVVDDADHVCREGTSLHLAEQATGDRRFINASIGELIQGTATVRPGPDKMVIFSPFGLGVLDIALAHYVSVAAQAAGRGTPVPDFLPGTAEPVTPVTPIAAQSG
jgi:ornithine cyclodeaminase